MIKLEIGKDYEKKKIKLIDIRDDATEIISPRIRYIEITSCNPKAFNNPDPELIVPSEKIYNSWDLPADDGSVSYLVTGVEDSESQLSGGFISRAYYSSPYLNVPLVLDSKKILNLYADRYLYFVEFFPSKFAKYERIFYDPFNLYNSEDFNYNYQGRTVPGALFTTIGSPILGSKSSTLPIIILDDSPRAFSHINQDYRLFNVKDEVFLNSILNLMTLFDSYSLYNTGIEEYYGYDKIIIHYDPVSNTFKSPNEGSPPVDTIYVKSDRLSQPTDTPTNMPKITYTTNHYPVPFILTSGTNVIKADEEEIIILYSQKNQNRPSVTYGSIYDNNAEIPKTFSCVDACMQRLSSLPTTCQPQEECKLGCPATKQIQNQISACMKKIQKFYTCQEREARTYNRLKNPKITEMEYLDKVCGSSAPCQMPEFVPNTACSNECKEEESLCKNYDLLTKKIGCQVACSSKSIPLCTESAFQIKLKAKKWTRVTIPDIKSAINGIPTVISAKEFFDCPGLQIKTLKGKKVGVAANYLKSEETYAFRTSKACVVKYLPQSCRSDVALNLRNAKISEEELQDPDEE